MEQGSQNLTFRDIIDASTLNLSSGSQLTLSDISIGLFVTLMCSIVIAWTYRYTYQGVLYQKSFLAGLILASLVTTSIIMVISGNLVLSLGMVGALSIVRFRAAIKDPIDIVFMFWAISVGIANGVASLKVSILSTILLSLVMVLIKKLPTTSTPFLLIVKYRSESEKDIFDIIKKNTKKCSIKSKTVKNGQNEVIYEVRGVDEHTLMTNLDSHDDDNETVLIAYDNNG